MLSSMVMFLTLISSPLISVARELEVRGRGEGFGFGKSGKK